jgi:hypothetical protein
MVEVLYLVYADPEEHTEKDDDEEDDIDEIIPTKGLEIVNTHLWTFCRDSNGEWNIVAMDH